MIRRVARIKARCIDLKIVFFFRLAGAYDSGGYAIAFINAKMIARSFLLLQMRRRHNSTMRVSSTPLVPECLNTLGHSGKWQTVQRNGPFN